MNSKQLQQEIEATQAQLKKLQEQLEATNSITIETAQPGYILPDGCVVVERYPDSILIAAPANTQARCTWTPDFPEVFTSLKDHGFIPAQWHVPSKEELQLAYKKCKKNFSSTFYWSSTEISSTNACLVSFCIGSTLGCTKAFTFCVRAFRRVTL